MSLNWMGTLMPSVMIPEEEIASPSPGATAGPGGDEGLGLDDDFAIDPDDGDGAADESWGEFDDPFEDDEKKQSDS